MVGATPFAAVPANEDAIRNVMAAVDRRNANAVLVAPPGIKIETVGPSPAVLAELEAIRLRGVAAVAQNGDATRFMVEVDDFARLNDMTVDAILAIMDQHAPKAAGVVPECCQGGVPCTCSDGHDPECGCSHEAPSTCCICGGAAGSCPHTMAPEDMLAEAAASPQPRAESVTCVP
jgi:predicted DNA-binding protein (UPF0251 family)